MNIDLVSDTLLIPRPGEEDMHAARMWKSFDAVPFVDDRGKWD
jgi:hypothetical protein